MKGNSSPGIAEKNKSNLPLINTDDTDLKKQTLHRGGAEKKPEQFFSFFGPLPISFISVYQW